MNRPAVRFTVPGDAVSFQTKVTQIPIGKGKTVSGTRKIPKAERWERAVYLAAVEAMDGAPPFEGPVEVIFTAIFTRPGKQAVTKDRPREWKTTKPDADKIERLIWDALTGVVFHDDNQVARHHGQKLLGYQGRRGGRIEVGHTIVTVRKLEDLAP